MRIEWCGALMDAGPPPTTCGLLKGHVSPHGYGDAREVADAGRARRIERATRFLFERAVVDLAKMLGLFGSEDYGIMRTWDEYVSEEPPAGIDRTAQVEEWLDIGRDLIREVDA